jgi:hypothetical protein
MPANFRDAVARRRKGTTLAARLRAARAFDESKPYVRQNGVGNEEIIAEHVGISSVGRLSLPVTRSLGHIGFDIAATPDQPIQQTNTPMFRVEELASP